MLVSMSASVLTQSHTHTYATTQALSCGFQSQSLLTDLIQQLFKAGEGYKLPAFHSQSAPLWSSSPD